MANWYIYSKKIKKLSVRSALSLGQNVVKKWQPRYASPLKFWRIIQKQSYLTAGLFFYAHFTEVTDIRKLKKYTPTPFMAKGSHYDKALADYAVSFIQCLCHTKGTWAATPEGRIVRMADQIAYVNHDIEDAVRAGVLDPATLPRECTAVLGETKSQRITTMINSILRSSEGDVQVGAEENEAFLAVKELGPDKFDIIVPSLSVLAQPPVAIVDKNVDKKGTRQVAQAYLEYLYSEAGQEIAARNYYRPTLDKVAKKYAKQFPAVTLFTVDEAFGGWSKAKEVHFKDGGVFDQIFTRR